MKYVSFVLDDAEEKKMQKIRKPENQSMKSLFMELVEFKFSEMK